MGIYERDYYRQGGSGFRLRAPRTAIVAIILINAAVFIAERAVQPPGRPLASENKVANLLSNHVDLGYRDWNGNLHPPEYDTLTRPWMWWQFLTCGFVHDPNGIEHILFNLLTLFFLGRDVEEWYGKQEFTRLYLAALVFSSVVWAVSDRIFHPFPPGMCLGASGAISGVVVLYALLFPKRTLLFMFILPLPAWLLGAMAIGYDIYGAMGKTGEPVAYAAHLGGAVFALAYYYFHWNIGRAVAPAIVWLKGRSRPSLKVFKPDDDPEAPVTDEEVDRILSKIHREGENSLTPKERRIMEHASREYRRRRRPE